MEQTNRSLVIAAQPPLYHPPLSVDRPVNSIPRIVFFGRVGIGKSTAIRTLCGELAVDCDVENLDRETYDKATTTVGMDFGAIDIGDGQQLHVYGSPGQDRFHVVRNWLLSLAIGVIILVDPNEADAFESCVSLIKEVQALPNEVVPLVLIARPCSELKVRQFSEQIADACGWAIPTFEADVRERAQLLNVLEVLFAMLDVKPES